MNGEQPSRVGYPKRVKERATFPGRIPELDERRAAFPGGIPKTGEGLTPHSHQREYTANLSLATIDNRLHMNRQAIKEDHHSLLHLLGHALKATVAAKARHLRELYLASSIVGGIG